MINNTKYYLVLFVGMLTFASCVERGKPIEKVETTTTTNDKSITHYVCPKGHAGSDVQGACPECGSVYLHNQAFHGNGGLSIPQPALQDPFNTNSTPANTAPAAAQNAYGDYHYICPNGHPKGAGSASKCTVCDANLVHNQVYHK